MKKLFTSIRQGNLEDVKRILEKKPELLSCTAVTPPKKDHGQSPLQVAIKSDNPEIANYLLDLGADVNFMESEVFYKNDMRAPVWLDAVGQVFIGSYSGTWQERSETYLKLLRRLLELGADPNKKTSKSHYYGGAGRNAWMAALDEYDYYVKIPFDYATDLGKRKNQRYRELLDTVCRLTADYGVNIYDYNTEVRRLNTDQIVSNLVFNRELFYGLDETNELLQIKWIPLEASLRSYYEKDNPYYGADVSEERMTLFQELAHLEKERKEKEQKRKAEEAAHGSGLKTVPTFYNPEFEAQCLQEMEEYFQEVQIPFTEEELLKAIILSENKKTILNAALSLRYIGTEKSIPELKKLTLCPDKQTRHVSLYTLAKLADGKENEFISSLLFDKNFKDKILIMSSLFMSKNNPEAALSNVLKYSRKTTKNGKPIKNHLWDCHAMDWAYLALYAPEHPDSKLIFNKVNQNREIISEGHSKKYIDALCADFPDLFPPDASAQS